MLRSILYFAWSRLRSCPVDRLQRRRTRPLLRIEGRAEGLEPNRAEASPQMDPPEPGRTAATEDAGKHLRECLTL
jgi:hypothetical protein